MAGQTRAPGESLYEALMRMFRTIFEPWEKHPDMLRAYSRARAAPGETVWCAAASTLWCLRACPSCPGSTRSSCTISTTS